MPQGHIPPNPQLVPLPIAAPGSLGLNLQQANQVLPAEWSIESKNTVIDIGGRVASRLGLSAISGTPAAGQIRTIFEYRTPTGGSLPIISYDGGISSNLSNPSTNSLVGTISSVANGRWYFSNFNGKCIGFQAGQVPIVMQNQAGTFSNITGTGTIPTGGIGTAAFGRIWCMDADGQTLRWCALLDETNWATGDSGSINLSKVWTNGVDNVQAIAGFNGNLFVFGLRNILIYGSTNVTPIGLDPTQLTIVDTIEGVGCISQWTVAAVGKTDMWFCSLVGIQSISRLVIQKSPPNAMLTKYCRDAIITQLQAETYANISGFYSPTNGFYALCLPVSGYVWIADQRHIYTDQDGDTVARITRWALTLYSGIEFLNRNVYTTAPWSAGTVGQYISTSGDNNTNFQVVLQLPFIDFGQDVAARLKALKRLGALIYVRNNTNVTYTWYTDFNIGGSNSSTATVTGGTNAEWGIAQWAIDQWSGGILLTLLTMPGSTTGQYFSFSITASVGGGFAVQQAQLLAKILRPA